MIATSDNLSTTASSIQLHNTVGNMSYVQSNLHIVINRYNTVQVTAGTYCSPIKIEPSDYTYFVTNMQISFVSDVLTFMGMPVYGYYGDDHELFRIGAAQDVIPTIYAYDIIKL